MVQMNDHAWVHVDPVTDDRIMVRCPWHKDMHASLCISAKGGFCSACGAKANLTQIEFASNGRPECRGTLLAVLTLRDKLEKEYARKEEKKEEPGRRTFESGAVRSTEADGVRYDLISPIGLRRLAETYEEGAKKYADNNWLKGFPASDVLNHAMKHIEQFRSGDKSEDHLAHAVWNLFTLMHFEETRPDLMQSLGFAYGPFKIQREPLREGSSEEKKA